MWLDIMYGTFAQVQVDGSKQINLCSLWAFFLFLIFYLKGMQMITLTFASTSGFNPFIVHHAS